MRGIRNLMEAVQQMMLSVMATIVFLLVGVCCNGTADVVGVGMKSEDDSDVAEGISELVGRISCPTGHNKVNAALCYNGW
jgi:hypothetical protein